MVAEHKICPPLLWHRQFSAVIDAAELPRDLGRRVLSLTTYLPFRDSFRFPRPLPAKSLRHGATSQGLGLSET